MTKHQCRFADMTKSLNNLSASFVTFQSLPMFRHWVSGFIMNSSFLPVFCGNPLMSVVLFCSSSSCSDFRKVSGSYVTWGFWRLMESKLHEFANTSPLWEALSALCVPVTHWEQKEAGGGLWGVGAHSADGWGQTFKCSSQKTLGFCEFHIFFFFDSWGSCHHTCLTHKNVK